MACSGDNVTSVFVWCVVVTMSELVCLCGTMSSSVFVWRLVVEMSDLVCLCGV